MPWIIVKDDDRFCVHKKNEDGSAGEKIACYDNEEEAVARMKALYANAEALLGRSESLDDEINKIRDSFWSKFNPAQTGMSNYVIEVFSDHVIAKIGEDSYSIGYTKQNEEVIFDARDKWIKVEPTYIKTAKLHEAANLSKQGTRWRVAIVQEGRSKQAPHYVYTKAALKQAADKKVFEGIKVFAHKDGPHVEADKKSVRDQVAWIDNVGYRENGIAVLEGDFNILPSEEWLRQNLLAAYSKGKIDLYELSIDAAGQASEDNRVTSIDYVDSVDIVPRGAAGGGFKQLLESFTGEKQMRDMLIGLLKEIAPRFLEEKKLDVANASDDQIIIWLKEAIGTLGEQARKDAEDKLKALQASQATNDAKLNEALTKFNEANRRFSEMMLKAKVAESGLPQVLRDEILAQYTGRSDFSEDEVEKSIARVKETYGKLSAHFADTHGLHVRAGMDELDKAQLALDGFFLTASQRLKPSAFNRLDADYDKQTREMLQGVTPFKSIKEAYIHFTGDVDVTGIKDPRRRRFSESIVAADWAEVLQNSMTKALVRDYAQLGLDTWRAFVDVVPVSDFKTQQRVRWGGYANLPTVAERGAYLPLTSPSDEQVTYTVAKRGGTEDVTLEAIKNDDLGAIQRIPTRLARAAGQTLHEFVYDFVNPAINPIYEPDGLALYHTTHANIGSAALGTDGVALFNARTRMLKQTQAGSLKRLGLRGQYLLIPADLERTAYDLLTPAAAENNMVPDFLQQVAISYIVVHYWTDPNNWVLVANRADITGLEIGFLDGKETPEIFVSDLPNTGSWFTNDVLTYKLRFVFGGGLLDFRAYDGSIVA